MVQLLPGHGWLDVIGIVVLSTVAVAGFFAGLAVLASRADPDADGVAERWPRR
jgi:hypothetical protein